MTGRTPGRMSAAATARVRTAATSSNTRQLRSKAANPSKATSAPMLSAHSQPISKKRVAEEPPSTPAPSAKRQVSGSKKTSASASDDSSSLQLTAEEVAILQKIKTAKGKGSLTGRMQAAQDARMLFPCPLIVYMHQPIVFAVVQQRNAQMLEAETAQQESQTNQTNISSLDEEEQALAAATRSRARSTALGMS